jgi:hypothetical protein
LTARKETPPSCGIAYKFLFNPDDRPLVRRRNLIIDLEQILDDLFACRCRELAKKIVFMSLSRCPLH